MKTQTMISVTAAFLILTGCEAATVRVENVTAASPQVVPVQQDPVVVPPAQDPITPPPAQAPEVWAFGGGLGTLGSPYLITREEDVDHIRDFPSAYYSVTQDINMAGIDFQPIPSFNGVLYGNNFQIVNLAIHTQGSTRAAFVDTLGGTLVNVKILNAVVSSQSGFASLVAGSALSTALVSSCSITGTVTSPLGGNGFNTGIGAPYYVSKANGARFLNATQNVRFNGNTVNATLNN